MEERKDTISRQAAIDALAKVAREKFNLSDEFNHYLAGLMDGEYAFRRLPPAQPERKNDIIQKFHDYQIEWLKSHYDIELEPQLEEMIVRFLHDTANCYMMEVGHDN